MYVDVHVCAYACMYVGGAGRGLRAQLYCAFSSFDYQDRQGMYDCAHIYTYYAYIDVYDVRLSYGKHPVTFF